MKITYLSLMWLVIACCTNSFSAVTGKVVDFKGYPLPKSKISVGNESVVADAEGMFSIGPTAIYKAPHISKQNIQLSKNILKIDVSHSKQQKVNLTIYSLTGKRLFQKAVCSDLGSEVTINLNPFFKKNGFPGVCVFSVVIDHKNVSFLVNTLFKHKTIEMMICTNTHTSALHRSLDEVEIEKPGYVTKKVAVPANGQVGTVSLECNYDADTVEAPFDVPTYYPPSGIMGDIDNVSILPNNETNIRDKDPDKENIKIVYKKEGSIQKWAGTEFQYPEHNWGEEQGRCLVKATKVTFYARGELGGEKVKFLVGGRPNAINPYNNSLYLEKRSTLTANWEKYEVDLTDKKLDSVLWGFGWVVPEVDIVGEQMIFYLDEIRYE